MFRSVTPSLRRVQRPREILNPYELDLQFGFDTAEVNTVNRKKRFSPFTQDARSQPCMRNRSHKSAHAFYLQYYLLDFYEILHNKYELML
jgi:hypothetical protein